ncbi:MAG TPA: PKD domain-containing protein, partial [Chitinophagaceae bacterium]|nr:PKD domain-containing protein [Chitinophagaceae bacterium]
ISLTVTSQTGCSETISITNGVRTGTRPTVDFSFVPNNVCASTPVQFTDLSVTSPGAFVEWFWQFGDSLNSNLQNPLHVYEDTGTLTVRLAVSNNGCLDSTEKLIQILPPVAKFGYTVNCSNRLQVTFTDSSLTNAAYGPVSYEWRMGDPANTVFTGLPPPTFTYPALGTYTATLIVTNGACSYQKQETVILSNEAPAFSINKNPVCKGEIFSLNATVSNPAQIADYSWTIGTTSFPDTSQSINHSLFAYGLYDVTLTIEDVNGCMNTVTVPNYITVSGPVADFSPNSPGACVDGTVSFTDQSMPVNSPIVQWTWNFGDGVQQTYSAPPFSHTYTQTGSYSVGLIIKDNGNCADTITIPNAVLITRPIAAFRADTVYCPLAPLQFTDTSSGTGLTYTWNFGDGGVATAQNPTHTYAPGNNSYTVKLKIRDLVGCEDSVSKTGYINIRSPRAAFDILDSSGICLPLLTTFTFQGSDYQSFYWDFGDGGSSQIQSPTHFYNSYGTYTPTLYLTGPGGCMDSARALVNAYDPSANTQVNLAPSTACNSISTNFLIDPPPGFRFKFIYGDGSIDSSQQTNLTHTYSSPGVYYPYVLLSDRFGCEAAVATSTPVTVFGAIPLFDKSRKEFCDNGEVFFVNYTLNNDPIISTVWDFGDGSTSTQSDPSHIFSNPGTYLVRLSVVTQNQCASSYTDTIRVYKTPELSIGGRDTICVNSPEQFNGIITQPDSTIKWQWTLGNGTSSQVQNPLVTFTSTGDLTMQLIATNKLGCADTATQNIHVSPPPAAIAVATPLTIISGGAAQLLMNYTGNISNYTWSPSTHLTCTDCPTPIANPQFSTTYTVEVVDRNGCRNTGDIRVEIVCNGQNFFVPNTFSPNGDGSNDVFYLRGTGLFRVKALRVFNRWGELVFEKREFPVNNAASGWDGTYKGKKAQPDVYVYQLEIICNNGQTIQYAGNIALIR